MHTISSLGTAYLSLLSSQYGTLTRSVTACLIAASGDIACQTANSGGSHASNSGGSGGGGKGLDLSRTIKMSAWPLLTTPLVARWYTLLGSRWPRSPLKRMIADQVLWAPPATLAMLLFFGGLENRNGSAPVFEAAKEKFIPTITANWAVWPAVQLVNFAMVPPSLQVLFSNAIGLGWGFYLSKIANPTSTKES